MLKLSIQKPLRKYESIVILHPDASEADQKAIFTKSQEIIKSFSGEYNHIDTWGKRKLGNPIEKLRMGTFFHTTFEAQAECISELERTFRINDKVLRFMHTRLDDRVSLTKHLEQYRDVMAASSQREQERESKIQARKAAMAAKRGPRRD